MDGAELRGAIIDALERDLCGPMVDESGCYPGCLPKLIEPGTAFVRQDNTYGVSWTADHNEVIRFIPTSRYGIGVLYPALSRNAEEALDDKLVQEDEAPAEEPAPQRVTTPASFPEDLTLEPEEVSEGRTERPSAMAISFVVKPGTNLSLEVFGATYKPFPVTVDGVPQEWWQRNPLPPTRRTLKLSGSGARESYDADPIQFGSLELKVGAMVHAREPGVEEQVVTCWVRNTSKAQSLQDVAASCLFQSRLHVRIPAEALFEYRQPFQVPNDDASVHLLYRQSPVHAIGHGCDAGFEETEEGTVILSTQTLPIAEIPATSVAVTTDGQEGVGMGALADWDAGALSGVQRLLDGYQTWIEEQQERLGDVPESLLAVANEHLQECQQFLDDARQGWQLAKDNSLVQDCLRWTARAMANQQLAYRAETRSIDIDKSGTVIVHGQNPSESHELPTWRPFQLIFLLSHLSAVIDNCHPRRGSVDVIWMPTGGGKTEAYLALAGFTMLWRRINGHDHSDRGGTTVLMRYTLRLLTAQQLQRTASLICALEQIREQNKPVLGTDRFAVGAWLGTASTPNTRDDALNRLSKFLNGSGQRPFLLTRCPWCACDMTNRQVFGYLRQQLSGNQGSRVQSRCPNPECFFGKDSRGLPVYEVDEDLYQKPPTFLLATVDKFAMLAWQENARAFFGIDSRGMRVRPAPSLIIQDELHLITGPLGSLVGLYEGSIANLCEFDGGIRPRVVAATATTKAYERQVQLLFNASKVRLIPPAGISISDSYFSHADETVPSKMYVGVCAPGLGSFTRTQARVLASLAHAVGALLPTAGQAADYYWTNVVFFGSLRDLGLSKSLISTDLPGFQYSLARATGVRSGRAKTDGTLAAVRYLTDTELTSASSQSASDALARLERHREEEGCVDLALATSVIEVGVDVSRLGLLTIIRQPKTAATYIQVAGRVGRSFRDGPGLVVVLLDARRRRDLSHFERFTAYHKRLFSAVEPASVTPFTDAALERGLRGAVAAVVRQTRRQDGDAVTQGDRELARDAASYLKNRANVLGATHNVDGEWLLADNEMASAVSEPIKWGNAGPVTDTQFLRRPETVVPPNRPSWPVPTSLRTVDNNGGLRVDPSWLPPSERYDGIAEGVPVRMPSQPADTADAEW